MPLGRRNKARVNLTNYISSKRKKILNKAPQINDAINKLEREYASSYNIGVYSNEAAESQTSSYVPSLTGIRGLAALIVAYSHYSGSGGTLGQIGVQIFFVLSGYLMSVLYLDKSERKPGEFIWNRLVRVVPLLAVVEMVSKVCSWFPGLKFYDIFAAEEPLWKYLSLKSGTTIEWTIAMEVAFYLMFAAVLSLPKTLRFTCLFLTTMGGIITLIFEPTRKFEAVTGIYWGILTSKAYVFKWFTLGIFTWFLEGTFVEKKWLHPRNMTEIRCKIVIETVFSQIFAASFVVRFIYWETRRAGLFNNWNSMVDAFGVVMLLLGSKHMWPLRSLFSSWLMHHVGKVSYSFYLTHMFVFVFFNRNGLRDAGRPPLVFIFLAACTLISTITFYCVEKPVNSALRKAWKKLENDTRKRQEEILPF